MGCRRPVGKINQSRLMTLRLREESRKVRGYETATGTASTTAVIK